MLSGKKTYICAALMVLVLIAHILGAIDFQTMVKILTLLGAGATAALRHAVEKLQG